MKCLPLTTILGVRPTLVVNGMLVIPPPLHVGIVLVILLIPHRSAVVPSNSLNKIILRIRNFFSVWIEGRRCMISAIYCVCGTTKMTVGFMVQGKIKQTSKQTKQKERYYTT